MANASDVQITASLIDAYLQIQDAPVAENLAGRFVAVQDSTGQQPVCLLTVGPSGDMVQLQQDATSHSGWRTTTIPVPPPSNTRGSIARIAGFGQGGALNALAYFGLQGGSGSAAVWMRSTAPGVWAQATLSDDAANDLGWTYQTDSFVDAAGNQYLYGVTGTGAFFLVAYDAAQGQFDEVHKQYLQYFTPAILDAEAAAFRMMEGTGGDQFTILWIDKGVLYFQGASFTDGGFQWAAGQPFSFDPGLGPLTVGQVVALPGPAGQSNLLIVDGEQTLHLFQDFNGAAPRASTLTGGSGQPAGAASVSVGLDASGVLNVFVLEEATQRLWIKRQTPGTGSVPDFADWVPLGNMLDAIACPPRMSGGAELFMVDLRQGAYHMAQTPADQVWTPRKIAAPAPSGQPPRNIAATAMELAVVDATGAPVAGPVVVSVQTDQTTTLVVDNLSYPVAPGAPAHLPSDQAGRLTVSVQTVGLSAPVLTFTAANPDGTSAQRWCRGDVVEVKAGETAAPPCPQSVANRLAGNDPTRPITKDSLTSAGLMDPDYADPSGAATAITSAGQWMLSNSRTTGNALDLSRVTTRHWRVDFTHPSGPRFEVLTQEDARRFRAECGARRAAAGAPGSLSSFFGDVANFFKHLWNELETFTVTLEQDGLHILFNAEEFIIDTVRQAATALETVWSRIMQGLKDVYELIEEVVDFLKQLFEWGDILRTHTVIRYAVNQFLDQVVSSAEDAEAYVSAQFGALSTMIGNAFGNLEKSFEPGQTFHAYVNAQGASPIGGGGNTLDAQPASVAYAQHGPRCNHVYSLAKSHLSGTTALAGVRGLGDSSSGISAAVQNNWAGQTFSDKSSAFQSYIAGNLSNPKEFFDLVVIDFLTALKDMVAFILDGLEDVAVAILQAAAGAVGGLRDIWNAQIEIPVLTWLYQNVITGTPANPGPPPSILDVLSLLLAVPATILYKVLHGNENAPFNDTDVATITSGNFPWPPFPSSAASLREGDVGDMPVSLATTLGVVAGVANFFGTFITTAADSLAFNEAPLPGFQTFISWASLIQGVVSQVGGAPWSVWSKPASEWSEADGWTTALWAASAVPLIYDSVFAFATGALARYTDKLGPVLDTGAGFALTTLAAGTVTEQAVQGSPYTGWDCANSIVPQVSRVFKFLLLTKGNAEAEVVAVPLLLGVDLALGLGATVTQIGNAVEG